MALPIPFILGAAVGAAGVLFVSNNKKATAIVNRTNKLMKKKLEKGVSNVKAVAECIVEKSEERKKKVSK